MPKDHYVPRFWRKAVCREARLRWNDSDLSTQSDLVILSKKIAEVPRPDYRYYYSGKEQHLLYVEISEVLNVAETIGCLDDDVRPEVEILYIIEGYSLTDAIESASRL